MKEILEDIECNINVLKTKLIQKRAEISCITECISDLESLQFTVERKIKELED